MPALLPILLGVGALGVAALALGRGRVSLPPGYEPAELPTSMRLTKSQYDALTIGRIVYVLVGPRKDGRPPFYGEDWTDDDYYVLRAKVDWVKGDTRGIYYQYEYLNRRGEGIDGHIQLDGHGYAGPDWLRPSLRGRFKEARALVE